MKSSNTLIYNTNSLRKQVWKFSFRSNGYRTSGNCCKMTFAYSSIVNYFSGASPRSRFLSLRTSKSESSRSPEPSLAMRSHASHNAGLSVACATLRNNFATSGDKRRRLLFSSFHRSTISCNIKGSTRILTLLIVVNSQWIRRNLTISGPRKRNFEYQTGESTHKTTVSKEIVANRQW